MDITIVTGLSGSGKSMALKHFEDMDFFCIDNMPPQLVVDLIRVLSQGEVTEETPGGDVRVALVMDTRNPHFVERLSPVLEQLQDIHVPVRILFLESSDAALISRYNQSRRDHPMAGNYSLAEAIRLEREQLAPVKALATDIVNTSDLSSIQMRERLLDLFGHTHKGGQMTIYIQSFGFKYGIPPDSHMLLDLRFMPNPFYIAELKLLSGLDQPVIEYLEQFSEVHRFVELQEELLRFSVPLYVREGKQRLNIGVGCTGGRHRSVMVSERLADFLRKLGYRVILLHRDLGSDTRLRKIREIEEQGADS